MIVAAAKRTFRAAFSAAIALSCGLPALAHAEALPLVWKSATQSPHPGVVDAKQAPLLALCGGSDAALMEVAARSAHRQLDGSSLLGADELAYNLRASGDPHVWPRAWSIAGQALDEDDVARRVKAWIAPWNTLGTRRCGIARVKGDDGMTVIAAVAIDALADLQPLPTTARVGQWITLDGTMLVPTTEAKVVLLGPRGAPKTVIASLSGSKIHSTFSVDQPGAWMVQVLATVTTGPRPVLEAMVFAGAAPPSQFVPVAAPGESAAKGAKDDDQGMFQMINAARVAEQLDPLVRDAALDKLARAHSEEMLRARMVGHDVGGGDPAARIKAAGIKAHVAGENVASAGTLENAHRALWASPSHRGNLLLDKFTHVGVAVVRAPDGMVWVTEMFSG
ncbi:MAG: CAP domain-containing protein [Byssovorax sp.]